MMNSDTITKFALSGKHEILLPYATVREIYYEAQAANLGVTEFVLR